MSYSQFYEIMAHDIDKNLCVKPSIIMRYMQETANRHMRDAKPSYVDLFNQGKNFILSRMNIEIYREIFQYDKIEVVTWPTSKGVSFLRSFQMKRGNELLAEGGATFALIDINTKKFLRCNEEYFSGYNEQPPLEKIFDCKARVPDEIDLHLRGERTVSYFDTDLNGHVNNTNYPDILANFIPEISNLRIVSMSLHFASEAKLDSNMSVFTSDQIIENDIVKYYVKSLVNGETNVVAEMKFVEIK